MERMNEREKEEKKVRTNSKKECEKERKRL